MYVAAYMARIDGLQSRALKLLHQVAQAYPSMAEPYVQALAIADRTGDVEASRWASLGVLRQAWPSNQRDLEDKARRMALAVLQQLEKDGKADAAASGVGRSVERGATVAAILGELGEWTHLLWRGETTRVCEEWRRLARGTLGGEPVSWKDGTEERRGIARDIADDGALLVDAGGRIERIVSGEVTWERHSRD